MNNFARSMLAMCAATAMLDSVSVYKPSSSFIEEGTFDPATISKAHRRNKRAKAQRRKKK